MSRKREMPVSEGEAVEAAEAPVVEVPEVPAAEPVADAALVAEDPLVTEEPATEEPKQEAEANGEAPQLSRAERDLAVLIEAAEIRQDSRRFMAARAIAGSATIL